MNDLEEALQSGERMAKDLHSRERDLKQIRNAFNALLNAPWDDARWADLDRLLPAHFPWQPPWDTS